MEHFQLVVAHPQPGDDPHQRVSALIRVQRRGNIQPIQAHHGFLRVGGKIDLHQHVSAADHVRPAGEGRDFKLVVCRLHRKRRGNHHYKNQNQLRCRFHYLK